MAARIAVQLNRSSSQFQFGSIVSKSCLSSSSSSSFHVFNFDFARSISSSSSSNRNSNSNCRIRNRSTTRQEHPPRRTFFTSLHGEPAHKSHDQAPFHTGNNYASHDESSGHSRRNDANSHHPGSRAFGECEISALSDLFLEFARTSSSVDDLGPYLNLEGIRRLLASVGESPDEDTLKALFDSINVNKDGKLRLDCFLRGADQVLGDSPARIVLVVGGPGSGKGELCKRLERECGAVHLSCGELLRSEVEADTPLGREVRSIMEHGGLVSSAVVTALMRRRMRQYPGKRILLDGFPRSLENARDFVELCGPPELALHLDCEDTVLLERILARGGKSAREAELAAEEGNVQALANIRSDDNIHTALNRLKTYHKHHRPTMEWLKSIRVPIVELDCSGSKDEVWGQLMAIGRLMRPAVKIPQAGQEVLAQNARQRNMEEREDMQWFA
mmetsp:Transcript_30093/g.63388  ORF Transcript_30093/g.63388 Transcript_30093/m.63388 type:complete len:446 (-) Transcript_30093:152-1489(-)|eukprot:CAMPEP_0171346582 /NCGR_PEP_ID=MMETSP0878-20121228/25225_1 /TAXON_ID=67004 /ORGANISM="Thalassiosira weissflogii, Strain CCMP1336" /LENGTH=445 /DNA_ID=CAMNT_0011850297 /DNA_START=54 /DNA_END=1391 /DNA_ORIENTATION=-